MKIQTTAGLLLTSAVLATQSFGLQGPIKKPVQQKSWPICQAFGERKVQPADLATNDIYGAAFAVDGDVGLVASEWDDDQGKDSGAVFVYRCNGRTWREAQKLLPSDGQAGDNFGRSIEMDGNVAVIGAHWDDDNGTNSGSAYVFHDPGTGWVQAQKLRANDGQALDHMGNSVSIDGDVIVVSAWKEDQGGPEAGAAYVFRFNGTEWLQEQKLKASDSGAGDNFGRHVSVSGNVIAVGAWMDDDLVSNSGAVYMFRYNGSNWVQEQKLKASDAASNSLLGWSVYVDGKTVVAGAFGDNAMGTQSGAAYVWEYDGAQWNNEEKILPNDGQAFDYFGFSIAVDGDTLAVGASVKLTEFLGPGSVYLFERKRQGWAQTHKVTPSDGAPQDAFGFHLALDANVLVTGSWRNDDAGPDSGAAYFYTFQDI